MHEGKRHPNDDAARKRHASMRANVIQMAVQLTPNMDAMRAAPLDGGVTLGRHGSVHLAPFM